MKPVSTGKAMAAQHIKGGRDGHIYWTGSKPFMKRKLAKQRRRADKKEIV